VEDGLNPAKTVGIEASKLAAESRVVVEGMAQIRVDMRYMKICTKNDGSRTFKRPVKEG
jgi:hypothetical protein